MLANALSGAAIGLGMLAKALVRVTGVGRGAAPALPG